MLPPLCSVPSSFQIILSCKAETPDAQADMSASTHPVHNRIEVYLTAFTPLAPLLKLPEGELRVAVHTGRDSVAFWPKPSSAPLSEFLAHLALLGAEDLAEIRRQVEGYPYRQIAEEYKQRTLAARRTRRITPLIELDSSPLLPLTVSSVLGGPSTMIRTSSRRDVIRLRGVPFNHAFARLANDCLVKNMRAALKAYLPILGRSRHSTRS
ncbi:hypothetical protein HZA87_00395 [Candidatus Uhrbacteria bacterium]|nr:hypothetical protein [Candidatus Uhrbacteria bacterium]